MSKQHDRILRGAMAGFVLFALAGSMNAVIAAPQVDAPAVPAPVQDTPALPRFEPAAVAGDVTADAVPGQAQAAAEEVLSEIAGGLASWYGSELAGRRTASGERFDPAGYTAAHRSLPFGSKVRVTSVSSGRSVIVRINDRGPFARGRVIDVSQAAARDLGLVASGSGNVRLQLIAS
ncbi:MAG: septal ring lytic transglycosylase RlpA family protein [Croceibacterium sp.]